LPHLCGLEELLLFLSLSEPSLLPGLSGLLPELRKLLLPSSLALPLSRRALKLPSLALILPHLCGLEELLLTLLIDSGVGLVNNVAPGIPSTVAFYKVLPIDLSITGSSIEVVRFLKYLNNPSSFFTLESFSITKSGQDLFRADLKINAVMLKKEGTS
jgi:hypothetical protein